MSVFLGRIHYWLFNKIKLVQERQQLLFSRAEAMCGSLAEELEAQVRQTYGEPLPDKDLAELIDHSNIHGWLQRQINRVESREAAFINELLIMCGYAAQEVIESVFYEHGQAKGKQARQDGRYDTGTASGIYKAINDYLLNGMPCDQDDVIIEQSPTKLIWESSHCAQQPNWDRVGVSVTYMHKFYEIWLSAFISGLNDEFAYQQTVTGRTIRREIFRKQ